LQSVFAIGTFPSLLHVAADRRDIAFFKSSGPVPFLNDSADDFVPGHDGVIRSTPFVSDHMKIRMADPAVKDIDENVLRAKIAPFEIKRAKR